MKFLSVCSGIEAASVAWNPIGWEAVGFSEIEPFPCGLLKHHYPSVPNFGDMTKFKEWPDATIDVLCGGTPCQSFSVAGLRKGLDDPRGNLMLTFLAIAKRYRPSWVVWENVPGVLSSDGGRDFGSFLGGLAECGYGFAYRVLDAQYFGVAQRRKRVFVVGYLGNWHRAAAVLFEQHSLQGHPAPSREKGKRVAPTIDASFGRLQGCSGQDANNGHGHLIPSTSMCLNAGGQQRLDAESETLIPTIGGGFDAQAFDWQSGGDSRGLDPKPTAQLQACQVPAVMQPVAFEPGSIARNAGPVGESPLAPTLRREMGDNQPAVRIDMQVRRLTPVECERLQGFPDNYTAIPWRKKPAIECPDGPRYKALGNSWAVPVARWIGERINKVEAWTS